MLTHEDLSKVRLLVLANKQDVKGCMTAAEISQERIQMILWSLQFNNKLLRNLLGTIIICKKATSTD